jgi:hypothetical protein
MQAFTFLSCKLSKAFSTICINVGDGRSIGTRTQSRSSLSEHRDKRPSGSNHKSGDRLCDRSRPVPLGLDRKFKQNATLRHGLGLAHR